VRILAIGNMYPPHHLGGYELIWRSAVRHHRAAGHHVRVLTSDVRFGEPDEADDPECFRVLRWYWRDHGWPRLSPRQRLALERDNARTLGRHIADFRPDVAAWWAMGGMSLSLPARAGVPGAAFVLDDWLDYAPGEDQWQRLFAGRRRALAPLGRALGGAPVRFSPAAIDHWVFISEYTRERARRHGLELCSSEVNPAGVGEEFLQAVPAQPWAWRLLYVGRIDERKGIDTAVRALARLPAEATLDVVGSGDDEAERRLRGLVAELRLEARVRFTGILPRDELPARYAAADAALFPVRWREPWGVVPLEAMGVGRPVVATGRGGSGEYLRDGENALLFEADDAAALAAQVRRLAADPALRERLRAGGLETARRHTAARHDARATAVLEGLRRA
jgi:glycosyltransferase involved in cell wall biosynthesis